MPNRLINRNAKTITFSLSPEMAGHVQDVMRDEGRNDKEERAWPWTIRYERLRTRHAEQED